MEGARLPASSGCLYGPQDQGLIGAWVPNGNTEPYFPCLGVCVPNLIQTHQSNRTVLEPHRILLLVCLGFLDNVLEPRRAAPEDAVMRGLAVHTPLGAL